MKSQTEKSCFTFLVYVPTHNNLLLIAYSCLIRQIVSCQSTMLRLRNIDNGLKHREFYSNFQNGSIFEVLC